MKTLRQQSTHFKSHCRITQSRFFDHDDADAIAAEMRLNRHRKRLGIPPIEINDAVENY